MHDSISSSIGTVYDIDEFHFIAEIEEYYFKELKQDIEIEILQGKSSTEGLLNLKLIDKHGNTKILNDGESIKLIERVFDIEVDEVYVNFAAHIVYLIVLRHLPKLNS
ncbi:hypothetical protein ACJ2A9_19465 [Anaerobacillus sp. MEB173]|uniref:hypothetical protein n=1 Tax=Anaerobacillus sp. MEB173 TaxID=3383345 RepID=UPI003F93F3C4